MALGMEKMEADTDRAERCWAAKKVLDAILDFA